MLSMNSKISVSVFPRPGNFPVRGGVREHLRQLYLQLGAHPRIKMSFDEDTADVVHVESAYKSNHRKPDIYTCHGGFVPEPPLPIVLDNLKRTRIIVSVAQWIVDKYFPQYAHKTVIIPNGVVLSEWENIPPSGLAPGYVLYAKEHPYFMEDFIWLANDMPDQRFVSLVWPPDLQIPGNVDVVGLQSRESMRPILNDAGCLILTGSEVCPTMLLEAWACKVPVIAKNIDGSREIMKLVDFIEPWGTAVIGGFLYDGIDEVANLLMNSPNESLRELGADGYKLAAKDYQWPNLFEQYVRLYEAIVYDEVESIFDSQGQRSTQEVG